jgi:hypothetical protein
VVAIILAAFGEGALVRAIRGGVEHARVLAVARHTLPLEIGEMLGQRRRSEPRAVVAHHPRLHHHAPGVGPQADRHRRTPPAAKPRPAPGLARSKVVADMPRLLRGPHHLANEGLRTLGTLVSVADAAGPDAEIVVARRHEPKSPCNGDRRRLEH